MRSRTSVVFHVTKRVGDYTRRKMSSILDAKLDSINTKHRSVLWISGIGWMVVALIAAVLIEIILDINLGLSHAERVVFLVSDLILLAVILAWKIFRPLRRGPDREAWALRLEDAFPEFKTRLIAAVQFSHPMAVAGDSSPILAQEMVRQTESIAQHVEFKSVVSGAVAKKAIGFCVFTMLLALGLYLAFRPGNVSADLLARAFLSDRPLPRKTQISIISDLQKVARGDRVVISAKALGMVPKEGTIELRFADRLQKLPMEASAKRPDVFAYTIENVQDPFQYRVNLGDNRTEWLSIKVVPPPIVSRLECTQIFPAYTKLQPARCTLGDLTILSGSQLEIAAVISKPLMLNDSPEKRFHRLHLINIDPVADVPLKVDSVDDHKVSAIATIPRKTTGFSLQVKDQDGLIIRDPAVYRIDLIPDKEPQIKVTYPDRREELVTKVAMMEIGFDASDDFGLSRVSLKYKIDDGPAKAILLDIAAGNEAQPKLIHQRFAWKISRMAAELPPLMNLEGSTIEYWLEAVDNNDVTGPGIGRSEHLIARVVTEADKRAEILSRLGTSLQDVQKGTTDQELLHRNLGELILEKK